MFKWFCMGKKNTYSFAYDPLAALHNAPKLLGMELREKGNDRLEGGYYLNGEPHQWRRDKIKVFIGRGSVWVMEEGGRCISLTQWLIEFGGASDYKDALRMIKGESQALHWNGEMRQRVAQQIKYIDADVLRGAKAFPLEKSPLFRWMCGLFSESEVREVWDRYNVTADERGRTSFWYVNGDGKICHDKKIYYREDGHRDKERPMGRDYRVGDGFGGRCFFGAHLIPSDGEICCVESEKTALLCALYCPNKVWVATGGKSNLKGINQRFLLYPDMDAVEDWSGRGGTIVEWWRIWALPESERPHGADIGDMIVWEKYSKQKY